MKNVMHVLAGGLFTMSLVAFAVAVTASPAFALLDDCTNDGCTVDTRGKCNGGCTGAAGCECTKDGSVCDCSEGSIATPYGG